MVHPLDLSAGDYDYHHFINTDNHPGNDQVKLIRRVFEESGYVLAFPCKRGDIRIKLKAAVHAGAFFSFQGAVS